MPEEPNKSLDILGFKPLSSAIEKVTDGAVDGARAFLGRVCLPAAEEFGLLLQDHVKSWRSRNATVLASKAEARVKLYHGDTDVRVHPRIAHAVFDEGSWVEDEMTHTMWAGLLASGCDESGTDDSNVVFISILKQMTASQVRIIRYAVECAYKYVSAAGWPYSDDVTCSGEKLREVSGIQDVLRIDWELDHLRSMELIGGSNGGGGFSPSDDIADISPRALALHLYVRGEGFPGSPIEFWSLQRKPDPEPQPGP
jgi:hypothetical protein